MRIALLWLTLIAPLVGAEWRSLFDGRTFAGWSDPAQRMPPGDSWTIEDGCLKSRAAPKIREDLMTREEFGDFELEFEWRVVPGANSGLKYAIQETIFLDRGKVDPKIPFEHQVHAELERRQADRRNLRGQGEEYVVGFEYQVIDDSRHADAQRGTLYQAGALYAMSGATSRAARQPGQFNQARVVKRGSRVEHWLNGVRVVDTTLDAPEVHAAVAKRWTPAPHVKHLLSNRPKKRSPIGLQNHGDEAWFRNIRIRPL